MISLHSCVRHGNPLFRLWRSIVKTRRPNTSPDALSFGALRGGDRDRVAYGGRSAQVRSSRAMMVLAGERSVSTRVADWQFNRRPVSQSLPDFIRLPGSRQRSVSYSSWITVEAGGLDDGRIADVKVRHVVLRNVAKTPGSCRSAAP